MSLLLLVVVTALAHAAFVLGRTHRRAGGWVAMARGRQWSAVALVRERAAGLDSLAAPLPRDPPWGRVARTRLSDEVALLSARVDSAGAGASAAALVWALDPAARISTMPGIAEVGRRPDPGSMESLWAGETETCPPEVDPDTGPWIREVDWAERSSAEGPRSLGRFDPGELERRLEVLVSDLGTPSAETRAGECVDGAWNWGSLDDSSPCRGRYVGKTGSTDLTLRGGEGQGVLVVDGTLRLEGTQFRGLLLVEADLVLLEGARVEGLARVGGTLAIVDGSWVSGPCAAYRALDGIEGLRRPVVLPGAGWIQHGATASGGG